jgi:hypothetical protein
MPILIKPFLYIFAFGQAVVLFANVIGLACWLLIICVWLLIICVWLLIICVRAIVREFIAYAKANPGKISMWSPRVGTPPHVAGER